MKSIPPKRILILGQQGQVGWELQRTLTTLGNVIAVDRKQVDLTNRTTLSEIIREIRPNIIVNAAAYTAVDKAESERALAFAINAEAPALLAEEAKRLGAILVHYSTDYVFDGTKETPYLETDSPGPLNAYGASKLAGDQALAAIGGSYYILRTSWVYGARGKNFLLTMLKLAAERPQLRIVCDQVGAPTWSRLIAQATTHILWETLARPDDRWGLYNLTSAGQTSWCGFAEKIFALALKARGLPVPEVVGIPALEYPTPAKRPMHSALSTQKVEAAFGLALPQWDTALEQCLRDLRG